MFKVYGGRGSDCSGVTRRTFLQAGVLGGGLSLQDFYRAQAATRSTPRIEGASVILFWMSGGPGHMETWDPKPDAMAQFRGPFGATKTSISGIQFGELLPEEAKITNHLAILFHYAAYLGRGYNPFITESDPNQADFRVRNLTLARDVPITRLEDRKHLLELLDDTKRAE